MTFTSVKFALFVTVLLVAYYAFPKKKYQWTVLLAASYVFYFFVSIKLALFMVFTTVTTQYAGVLISNRNIKTKQTVKENKEVWSKEEKKAFKAAATAKNKSILALTLVLNFGILFFLKYYTFLADNINNLLGGGSAQLPIFDIILPLGISFYTFQSMGYIIDVYRGDVIAEKNVFRFALFVSFFPQIIQGPISPYSQLAHQLYEPHKLSYKRIKFGLELILWGLFKKFVIADRTANIIAVMQDKAGADGLNGTIATCIVILYAIQLYADFSAGIDIARGVAQMLGIDMIQNFRQPYFATSLTDYWNRWHISLGAWMRNYIFYPLALSQVAGKMTRAIKDSRFGSSKFGSHIGVVLPGALASFVVFLVVGIWHGAEWKYIWFGIWNGLVIMIAIIIKPFMDWLNKVLHIHVDSFAHRLFRIFRTLILVGIGYLFDVADTATTSFMYLVQIFTNQQIGSTVHFIARLPEETILDGMIIFVMAIVLLVVGILREKEPNVPLRERLNKRSTVLQWLILFFAIMAIIVLGVYGPGFNPQEFMYMQF